MTVRDLIIASLKLIGAVSATNPPTADELADAWARLQDMGDSWQAERLAIFQVVRTVFPLIAGQASYSIGPGGDFDIARPIWIQDAGIITNANSSQPLELPMGLLSDDDWASVRFKNIATTLSWNVYYDYGFDATGRGAIWFSPIPTVNTLSVALYVPTPVTTFPALGATIAFPPGYAEALRYNLAVRLCPEFSRPLDPVVAGLALETYARIERANKRLQRLGIDAALTASSASRVFNYLSGDSQGSGNMGGGT